MIVFLKKKNGKSIHTTKSLYCGLLTIVKMCRRIRHVGSTHKTGARTYIQMCVIKLEYVERKYDKNAKAIRTMISFLLDMQCERVCVTNSYLLL